jgi:hypothetical protein
MDKAILIGESLGVMRNQSSCDYSYLIRVRDALDKSHGRFEELAYIQKMIDVLEEA